MTSQALSDFEDHRQLLFGIAYRMLGTVMDAQDLVQDTFLRWQQSSPAEVQSKRALLTTVITRLCINHLKSARIQPDVYVGPSPPESIVSAPEPEQLVNSRLTDSPSLSFV